MVRVDWHASEYGRSVGPTDEYSSTHCMGWSKQPLGASPQLLWSSLPAMSPRVAPEWRLLFLIVVFIPIPTLARAGTFEVEALFAFRRSVIDPSGALRSWDDTFVNACSWLHITCNAEHRVVQMALGDAGLSGTLAPELGLLTNLQYLDLYHNNISGSIPKEFGNLSALVSLGLSQNNLTGPIPDSLGQLSNLRFLRMNNNSLDGPIPVSLTTIEGLQVLDLSYNNLTGEVPTNGSFSLFSPISFIGNKLCGSVLGIQCPGHPPFPLPAPNTQSDSPHTQEPKNRKVIILASTISAAVLMLAIVGFTFIICRNQKYSGDFQKSSKVADVEARKY